MRRMRSLIGVVVATALGVACSAPTRGDGGTGGGTGGGGVDASVPMDAGSDGGATCWRSTPSTDGGRWALSLPTAPNGVYDPDLEDQPDAGRLWMSYSGVDGPPGSGLVSTHLAWSDDHGVTWCELGVVNAATRVSGVDLPPGLDADAGHWNHETSALVNDPDAPPVERWKLVWHRYLYADKPDGGEGRRFEYGWIAQRTATTPEGLLTAPETKLFSVLGYQATPEIQVFNDNAPGGSPRQYLPTIPALQCLVVTEPSLVEVGGDLYAALFCYQSATQQDVVLLKQNRTTRNYEYVGTLLGVAQAQAFNPALSNFNAPDLVKRGNELRLLVSPAAALYVGCLSYPVTDVTTATVAMTPTYGLSATPGAAQTGACTYFDRTATGVLVGDVVETGVQFRLYATGRALP